MELEKFISSGILESYILGTATPLEIEQVKEMEKLYPEVTLELEALEATLLRLSEGETDAPAAKTKANIEKRIFRSGGVDATIIDIKNPNRSPDYSRYVAAASIVLLLGSGAFNLFLYKKYAAAKQELTVLYSEKAVLADQLKFQKTSLEQKTSELAMLMNPVNKMIPLKGMNQTSSSSAMIVWDTQDKSVYLNTTSLPKPQEGMQYQLWAMVKGQPVSVGLISMTEEGVVMTKVGELPVAEAFAVTLEKVGGSSSPHMEFLCLLGNV